MNSINDFTSRITIDYHKETDYHPGTDNKVQDIVHPSLYPLIINKKINNQTDFWNRPYEDSKFQWLPSEFKININGKCKIESYINNIPPDEIDLYNDIEKMFELVLPEFEKVWSFTNALKLYDIDSLDYNKKIHGGKYKNISLKNKTLQVITKIVKISLNNNDLLGAWHVEGMSHENIVATATITLEQNENFYSEIMFKRIYSLAESKYLGEKVYQYPSHEFDTLINKSHIPLGKIKIKERNMIVFPNSHIHKVEMESQIQSSRTIIVFWLINPNIRITSTRDIEQQNYNISKAYENRLELMKERTFYKQTFNQRDLNLCEH